MPLGWLAPLASNEVHSHDGVANAVSESAGEAVGDGGGGYVGDAVGDTVGESLGGVVIDTGGEESVMSSTGPSGMQSATPYEMPWRIRR